MTWCTFDPPYAGRDTSAYQPLSDYGELIHLLLHANFKWILSEYPNTIYQPLTDRFGSPLTIQTYKHGSRPVNGQRPKAVECLWANYDIRGILCPEGMMDVNLMIEQLEKRKEELEITLKILRSEVGDKMARRQSKITPQSTSKKRGHKWSAAEKAAMSAKLKASWAGRKKGKK
jgi:hypothetical protein